MGSSSAGRQKECGVCAVCVCAMCVAQICGWWCWSTANSKEGLKSRPKKYVTGGVSLMPALQIQQTRHQRYAAAPSFESRRQSCRRIMWKERKKERSEVPVAGRSCQKHTRRSSYSTEFGEPFSIKKFKIKLIKNGERMLFKCLASTFKIFQEVIKTYFPGLINALKCQGIYSHQ